MPREENVTENKDCTDKCYREIKNNCLINHKVAHCKSSRQKLARVMRRKIKLLKWKWEVRNGDMQVDSSSFWKVVK